MTEINKSNSAQVIMPSKLTSENGAKDLLRGEFSMEVEHVCSACAFYEAPENCEVCDGNVVYTKSHDIPWHVIKDIYAKAAEKLSTPIEHQGES